MRLSVQYMLYFCVEGMYVLDIVCALLYVDYTDISHIKSEAVITEMVNQLVDQ